MDCPVCRGPMIVLELNQVEIDFCLECEGVWLDAGELELLLESSEEKDAVLNSFIVKKDSKEKKRKCPICLKKMEKILCSKDGKILIDKCPRNDGIWLDRGELYRIIAAGTLDKNNKILTMLKDMMGGKSS